VTHILPVGRGSNPGGARFSAVQTVPGAHPASCTMGFGSFRGVKYGRGVLLTTHPLLVSRSWKSRAIPLPTLWTRTGPVTGTLYFCTFVLKPSVNKKTRTNICVSSAITVTRKRHNVTSPVHCLSYLTYEVNCEKASLFSYSQVDRDD